MLNTNLLLTLAGGLGLILLGMKLMTDGMKLAAGGLLRRVLANWTRSPLRGLLSGFLMTAAMQSSSAVTVAAIGFVNAGIISFANTVWVVYGSNIGSTTTVWIIALLGLKIKIKLLAMPMIAVGTALWITKGVTRRGAFGEGLAGFGLFFLGVDILQGAFLGLSNAVHLQDYALSGIAGQLAFVGLGFVLTFLMQASSACMALILTATAGGLISIDMAAAGVIGANLGTTSTAALAVIGATSNARRVAALHVLFNVITGVGALLILPFMIGGIIRAGAALDTSMAPATVLALFHTSFNILGVLLVGPVTGILVRLLKSRFRTDEENAARLQYLDETVLDTPVIASGAMVQEVARVGASALRMMYAALRCKNKKQPCRELHREKAILDKLQAEIGDFAARLRKRGLPQETAEAIPSIQRSLRYYVVAADAALEAEIVDSDLEALGIKELEYLREKLLEKAVTVSLYADPSDNKYSAQSLGKQQIEFEALYQNVKQNILDAGTSGRLSIDQMVKHLDYLSHVHRMIDQAAKGAVLLNDLGRDLGVYGRLRNVL